MRNQKPTLILLILFSLIFSSCSTDDGLSSNSVLFSAKINGELFEATKLKQATVIQYPDRGQRFDISAENDKYKILFAISNKNIGECMPNGDYENYDNDTEVLIDIYYKVEGTNNFISVHYPLEDSSGVTIENAVITSCSEGAISGIFSGNFSYEDDPDSPLGYPENIEITEGKFNNIEFIILTQ